MWSAPCRGRARKHAHARACAAPPPSDFALCFPRAEVHGAECGGLLGAEAHAAAVSAGPPRQSIPLPSGARARVHPGLLSALGNPPPPMCARDARGCSSLLSPPPRRACRTWTAQCCWTGPDPCLWAPTRPAPSGARASLLAPVPAAPPTFECAHVYLVWTQPLAQRPLLWGAPSLCRYFDVHGSLLKTSGVPEIAVHGAEHAVEGLPCKLGFNLCVCLSAGARSWRVRTFGLFMPEVVCWLRTHACLGPTHTHTPFPLVPMLGRRAHTSPPPPPPLTRTHACTCKHTPSPPTPPPPQSV